MDPIKSFTLTKSICATLQCLAARHVGQPLCLEWLVRVKCCQALFLIAVRKLLSHLFWIEWYQAQRW